MKKTTKAVLAAGAGLALLIGTGGTLALWNSSSELAGGTITAGTLQLAASGTPTWQIQRAGATTPEAVTDLAALRIVPGDKLIYTGNFTIAAEGRNLSFRANIAPGAITPARAGNAADTRLAQQLDLTAAYTINGVAGQTATITQTNDAASSYPARIVVTLDWPFDDPAGSSAAQDNVAKQGQVSLANFSLTATQVQRSAT
ncbi:alternate-type signal peptide domain-containing protein [Leucobacter luti]|uniref:alternate-type signal peptide domain-containing protein n=1 Tax=Leucobacter luti TaxID=340320 RepID=UPI003D038640